MPTKERHLAYQGDAPWSPAETPTEWRSKGKIEKKSSASAVNTLEAEGVRYRRAVFPYSQIGFSPDRIRENPLWGWQVMRTFVAETK